MGAKLSLWDVLFVRHPTARWMSCAFTPVPLLPCLFLYAKTLPSTTRPPQEQAPRALSRH